MRVLILGAGGVGGYIGARLAKYTDAEVSFIARGEHLSAIKSNGLKIIEDENQWLVNPAVVTDNPADLGLFDIIFVTVKATSLQDTLLSISNNVSEKTVIIPLLNGVNHDLTIKELYPNADVMNGCIYIISNIIKAGVIRKRGKIFKLCWGREDFDSNRYADIVALFEKAFERAEASKDIRLKQWKKFLFISPMATLTSKYGISMDRVYEKHFEELKESMREIVKLANALGVGLSDEDIKIQLKQASKVVPNAKTSMQLDIQKGVKPEIEALVGYVVKEADKKGIKMPLYRENYKILSQMID